MRSSAARVLEDYEYSREYRGVRREQAPRLEVKEGKRPESRLSMSILAKIYGTILGAAPVATSSILSEN